MMKKIAVLFLYLIATTLSCSSQFLPHNICFAKSRLAFSMSSSVAVDTSATGNSGDLNGCISDLNSGKLQFYADYGGILDYTHTLMQDGDFYFISGALSGSHSIIFNKPHDDSLYYCFYSIAYNSAFATYNNLRYSIINRYLNNGLGAVIPQYKNLYIDSINNTNTKVAATLHANGCYVWVASHECEGDKYYFYLVSDTGVAGPVINQIGTADQCNYALGCFKFSPDGKTFVGLGDKFLLELFDFDNATGNLSNPRIMSLGSQRDGVAFSPDNTKLYVSTGDGEIGQYDLTLPTWNDIINSRTVINPNSVLAQNSHKLQLGPDGKLYVSPRIQTSISVINYPDSLGLNCVFQDSLFVLNYVPQSTFSQFVDNCFNEIKLVVAIDTIVCENDTVHLQVDTVAMASGYQWVINDTTVTTLSGNSAYYIFKNAGAYEIKLYVLFDCMDTRPKNFTVHVNDGAQVSIAGDSSLCKGDTILLTASGNALSYLWNNGSTNNTLSVTQAGNYTVTATNNCGSKTETKTITSGGSSTYRTINVFTPNGDNKNDSFIPVDNVSVLKSFKIFNRWGMIIYEDKGINKWNGKINTNDAPPGTYFYEATITDCNKTEKIITGYFNLIR